MTKTNEWQHTLIEAEKATNNPSVLLCFFFVYSFFLCFSFLIDYSHRLEKKNGFPVLVLFQDWKNVRIIRINTSNNNSFILQIQKK